jgi:hypothetical protein
LLLDNSLPMVTPLQACLISALHRFVTSIENLACTLSCSFLLIPGNICLLNLQVCDAILTDVGYPLSFQCIRMH